MQERGLVVILGYLFSCLNTQSGTQSRAAYLSGCLFGIRPTHEVLGLEGLPAVRDLLRLKTAWEGYKMAVDKKFPPTAIRIRIPVQVLYSVPDWVARAQTPLLDLRDAALLMTATVFSLLAAGVQSILFEQVALNDARLQVLVGSLKRRTLDAALFRGGRSFYPPEAVLGHPRTVLELM